MPPIPAPAASGVTSSTEVPLYWVKYGVPGAPRLLVLHGGPGAHHDYLLPQMLELTRLAGGRELIMYDQRGGGRSKTDAREPVTWRTQVGDVAAVIREFGLDRPVIVGYSWGGLLAMLYASEAARDPSLPRPRALVLVDPAPISRRHRETFEREFARRGSSEKVQRLRAELAASGLRASDPDAYRQRNFELSVAGYFQDPDDAVDLTPFRVSSRVQQSVWDSLGDFDLAQDGTLARIDLPALIVHGRQDPIPLASSQEAAQILRAELVPIENCGHVPYVEQPEALFSAIDAFLRTL
ncbi:MAG TPA: alpha/beta hydrolase [Gemmatimonadaceae bacterium]|nr:alpha/beta hydrolase [Gemmatimonadaceae bacterium]